MPLNKKGKKIKTSMTKRYGKKKGEAIFYAMENSGKLKGVKKKVPEINKKIFPYDLVIAFNTGKILLDHVNGLTLQI